MNIVTVSRALRQAYPEHKSNFTIENGEVAFEKWVHPSAEKPTQKQIEKLVDDYRDKLEKDQQDEEQEWQTLRDKLGWKNLTDQEFELLKKKLRS